MICLQAGHFLITKSHSIAIENPNGKMKVEFEMNNFGKLSYFYGMWFRKVKEGIIMHEEKVFEGVIKYVWSEWLQQVTNPYEANVKLNAYNDEDKVYATRYKKIIGLFKYKIFKSFTFEKISKLTIIWNLSKVIIPFLL